MINEELVIKLHILNVPWRDISAKQNIYTSVSEELGKRLVPDDNICSQVLNGTEL